MTNPNRKPAGIAGAGEFTFGSAARSNLTLTSADDERDLSPVAVRNVKLGFIPGVGHVSLDLRLEPFQNPEAQDATTHQPVGDGMRLSVMSSTRYRNSDVSGGQDKDSVRALLRPDAKLADGWTREDIQDILTHWDSGHLNDMHAGCEHMADFTPNRYGPDGDNWDQRPSCPETGQSYGSTWYAKQLPAETEDWARDFAQRAQAS
jgi:hypothetical protein